MDSPNRKNNFVAVTGIGMITPIGINTTECWENMLAGKSGVRRITRFDPSSCASQIAGEIPDKYFDFEKRILSPEYIKTNILPSRLSMIVAKEAIADSGIDLKKIDQTRTGVITGCGGSTFGDHLELAGSLFDDMDLSGNMLDEISANVAEAFGFSGPAFNVATACSSGAYAVEIAYDYVRNHGDQCLALGVETMVGKEAVDAFCKLMALSVKNEFPEKASRPFDKNRDGFVISEGACAVLLESYEQAVRRGARIYAVMSGVASTAESHNIVAPETGGKALARTINWAIQNARIPKERIGYISAHGTSTIPNDRIETKAVKQVFGSGTKVAVSSQKSMIGHPVGAAGAIEFGITALSLYHQLITPTINYEARDPECDLDYVPNEARKVKGLDAALSNSLGFGGHNISIVLEKMKV